MRFQTEKHVPREPTPEEHVHLEGAKLFSLLLGHVALVRVPEVMETVFKDVY